MRLFQITEHQIQPRIEKDFQVGVVAKNLFLARRAGGLIPCPVSTACPILVGQNFGFRTKIGHVDKVPVNLYITVLFVYF